MCDSAASWLTDSPLGGGPPCLFMTGRLARGSGGLSRRDPRGGATDGCGTLLHIGCQPIESIAHTVLARSTCKLHIPRQSHHYIIKTMIIWYTLAQSFTQIQTFQ